MRQHFYRSNLRFRDKIFSLDFILIFLVLSLGIISFFTMYSTEQGQLGYFTKSHIYRFFIFFLIFILVSFLNLQFWYNPLIFFILQYLFYLLELIFMVLLPQVQNAGLVYLL